VVWAMEEYEADDALASAAFLAREDIRVERVVISTPDKDLAQCVQGTRVVQLDRRRRVERDEQGVIEKFGVKPSSIPDYLALVGDAADGYPGLPGWGAKSASAVLSRFGRLEAIPLNAQDWHVNISNLKNLSEVFKVGAIWPFSSETSLRFELIFRSSQPLMICSGRGLRLPLLPWQIAWTGLNSP
jgi:5'-3' exonuclease